MAITSTTARRRVAAALALAAVAAATTVVAAPPAGAALPSVPGTTLTHHPVGSGYRRSVLEVQLTTAHRLLVTCPGAEGGTLTLNATSTGLACRTLEFLAVTGTSAADTLDARIGGGPNRIVVEAHLGAGSDVSTTVTNNAALIHGEAGDDRLTDTRDGGTGRYAETWSATLDGGPGNDVLDDRGFQGTTDVPSPTDGHWPDVALRLVGGLGVDTIYGNDRRGDLAVIDTSDVVVLSGGPGTVDLTASSGADAITVDANGGYGPKVAVTTAGRTTSYALPALTSELVVRGGAGNDTIELGHRSARTRIVAWGGAGTDRLDLRPSVTGFGRRTYANGNGGEVTQTGWQPIGYGAEGSTDGGPKGGFETVSIALRYRP